jgi:hypothetical protein
VEPADGTSKADAIVRLRVELSRLLTLAAAAHGEGNYQLADERLVRVRDCTSRIAALERSDQPPRDTGGA